MKFFCFYKKLKFPFEDLSGDFNILYNRCYGCQEILMPFCILLNNFAHDTSAPSCFV